MPAGQMNLFGAADDRPSGLHYHAEFISSSIEQELVETISGLRLAPFQFGAFEGKRRVASFGWRYDYSDRRLVEAAPIPDWLRARAAEIEMMVGLETHAIQQILVTDYEIGAGIGWHRDKPQFDTVFGLSLSSPCRLRFRRKNGQRWDRYALEAQRRSLYVLAREARRVWEHSIASIAQRRLSITFRTMADGSRKSGRTVA